ncbi:hypothetical protein GCM10007989_23460 [Devosia pacifica]|uniref:Outer membrane beta-barrel protein n=2 Tax=Devosia pacifica TaxID=1335967 RepID=A0A918VVK4_9HYPH|nr:hypothetical protein GCM10007989_23460 [Devosia pacifica]
MIGLVLVGAGHVASAVAADARLEPDIRLEPGLLPLAPGSATEPTHPPVEIDWSTSLRGSYIKDRDGERFELQAVPRGTLDYQGRRGTLSASGEVTITRQEHEDPQIGAFDIGISGAYALADQTSAEGAASFTMTNPEATIRDIADTTADPADTISGTVLGSVTRQFGKLSVSAEGGAERTVYGETRLADGTNELNGDRNLWSVEGGLRVSYALTPILDVFARGGANRDYFDHPRPENGQFANATGTSFSVGVLGNWDGWMQAEASVGYGKRNFDAIAFEDAESLLYSARLTFNPYEPLTFSAGVDNSFGLPTSDSDATSTVTTNAYADLTYTANSWLRLRAAADVYRTRTMAEDETEKGYGYGVGADYLLNTHTQLTADYGYARAETAGEPAEDRHRVTFGVTLAR